MVEGVLDFVVIEGGDFFDYELQCHVLVCLFWCYVCGVVVV